MYVDEKAPGELQTKVTPSLAGFIAWAKMQPPGKVYEFAACNACAIAQYRFHATGDHHGQTLNSCVGGWENHRYIGAGGARTFGAALARAREIARA